MSADAGAKAIADGLTGLALVIVIPEPVDEAVIMSNGATHSAGASLVVIPATSITGQTSKPKVPDHHQAKQNQQRFHFIPLQ